MKSIFAKNSRKISEIFEMGKTGKIKCAGETFNPWVGFRELLAGWLLAGLLSFLLIFPLSAFANPPSDVQLSYVQKDQVLQVTIAHYSFTPNYHYIKRVEIRKNSENPLVHEYKNQPDKSPFTYTYKLLLKEGDRVEVKAICSLYGSKSGSLTISKPAIK
jgi:hypothetical protein